MALTATVSEAISWSRSAIPASTLAPIWFMVRAAPLINRYCWRKAGSCWTVRPTMLTMLARASKASALGDRRSAANAPCMCVAMRSRSAPVIGSRGMLG